MRDMNKLIFNPIISTYKFFGTKVNDEGEVVVKLPWRGFKLNRCTLYEYLRYTDTLDPLNKKGYDGGFFTYQGSVVGRYNSDEKYPCEENKGMKSNLAFVDIDELTNEEVDEVVNQETFDKLCSILPNLVAIQKSTSYYIGGNHGSGFHCYLITKDTPTIEFKEELTYATASLQLALKKVVGKEYKVDESVLNDLYKRSFTHYGEWLYNPNAYPFIYGDISKKEIKRLFPEYFIKENKSTTNTINEIKLSSINININDTYSTNANIVKRVYNYHFRWLYIQALKHVKNDFDWVFKTLSLFMEQKHSKGRSFSDNEWYDEVKRHFNGKTPYESAINSCLQQFEDWGIIDTSIRIEDEENVLHQGEYLTKYEDKILDFISKHKRCTIVAPTGSGKTTLINGYTEDVKHDEVFSQKRSIEGIASRLNAVVCVPYNSGNHLYCNLYEVSTTKGNSNIPIPSDRAVTLVLDQALKHIKEFEDRQIIIDESHILFSDREFRDRLAKLLDALMEDKYRICCVSATPSGETYKLGCDKNVLSFKRERRRIDVEEVFTNNVDFTLLSYAKSRYYDRIVVFSDQYSKKLYENLLSVYGTVNLAYIKSNFKDSPDFKNLRENEMLDKKVTICTRLAYNGLNFKNKNEKILVLVTYRENENLPCEVIQCIGRFRECGIKVKIIIDKESRHKEDLSERLARAQFYDMYWDKNESIKSLFSINFSRDLLEQDKYNTEKELGDYTKVNSTIDRLNEDLVELGYINLTKKESNVVDESGKEIKAQMVLKLKKVVDAMFYSDLVNCCIRYDMLGEGDMSKVYYNELYETWCRLRRYKGVDIKLIDELKKKSKKDKLLFTILKEIEDIIDVVNVSEERWNEFLIQRDANREYARSILKRVDYNKYVRRDREIVGYRNKYYGSITNLENANDIIESALSLFLGDVESNMVERIESSRAGGQKGKVVLYNGVRYESIRELADAISKPESTIYNWIKKDKVQYV